MKVLEIVNRQRQLLGRIAWESPDKITLEVVDVGSEAELTTIVDRTQQHGVWLKTARQVEEAGRTVIVDEQVVVKPDDERVLQALADAVSRYTINGQRAFGLIKEK